MILSFKEKCLLEEYQQLDEKLIMFNNGARYGQIVFLAGGAGSGKGFALANFMENDKFKVRDVDEWKAALLKINDLKGKYPEIKGLDLRKPADVFKLHTFTKKLKIKENTLTAMLNDIVRSGSAKKGTLPNIVFDITLKELSDMTDVLKLIEGIGYKAKDIHVNWVLTKYEVAVRNNQERPRIVPDDILLKTHKGAAQTMSEIVKGKLPRGVDGQVNVILNNRENTIPRLNKDGKVFVGKGQNGKGGSIVVKDFTYLRLKKEGKPFSKEAVVQKQVFDWIKQNAPKDALSTIDEPRI